MKQIRIIIEKTKDHFSSFAENVEGIYGAGETPQEAKESVVRAIDLFKKYISPENIPLILKEPYKIVSRFESIEL